MFPQCFLSYSKMIWHNWFFSSRTERISRFVDLVSGNPISSNSSSASAPRQCRDCHTRCEFLDAGQDMCGTWILSWVYKNLFFWETEQDDHWKSWKIRHDIHKSIVIYLKEWPVYIYQKHCQSIFLETEQDRSIYNISWLHNFSSHGYPSTLPKEPGLKYFRIWWEPGLASRHKSQK